MTPRCRRNGEPQLCDAEREAIKALVPTLGYRGTARKLDRDHKVILKWAKRAGVSSPHGFGRDWKSAMTATPDMERTPE